MNNELEGRVEKLESELEDTKKMLKILASVLSRYQFLDPRIIETPISVLDRLDKLERQQA